MDHIVNFKPINNYGQPSFGCSWEQYQHNQKICSLINARRYFQKRVYNHYHNKQIPQSPRLVTKALLVPIALNKNTNDWMQNIINF